jgi:transcriptional regulator with XRE-family HTH domain
VANSLGSLLRKWREARGLSVGALALAAGLSKGTISGWEREIHVPRVPELETVLRTLGASPAQRDHAFDLIQAPRAGRRRLAAVAAAFPEWGAPEAPTVGRLLRLMRHRRHMRVQDVAARLGVQASTVSRWERSELALAPERLSVLLELLGASAQECLWFAQNPRLGLPLASEGAVSLEELEEALNTLTRRAHRGDRALLDLEFLDWEARIWPLAQRSTAARELLTLGWAGYAMWLTWDNRLKEGSEYAQRAIEFANTGVSLSPVMCRALEEAVHVVGLAFIRSSDGPVEATRAFEYVHSWLREAGSVEWECALYRDLAGYAYRTGHRAAALGLADRAQLLAERTELLQPRMHSRAVRVDLFLRSGLAQKALPLLVPVGDYIEPFHQILEALRWVNVLWDLGDRSAAADHLTQAYDLIERYQYPNFRQSADDLARRF